MATFCHRLGRSETDIATLFQIIKSGLVILVLKSSLSFGSIENIFLGGSHVHAVDSSGNLYSWGSNDFGQLATGNVSQALWPKLQSNLPKIKAVVSRYDHSCVVDVSNVTRCFGRNSYGELGLGVTTLIIGNGPGQALSQLKSVDLGEDIPEGWILGTSHTCYVNQNRTLKCFGSNFVGEIGIGSKKKAVGTQPSDMGKNLVGVNLGDFKLVEGCAGNQFTCVRSEEGQVKCWGHGEKIGNQSGQNIGQDATNLGNSLKAVELGTSFKVSKLTCGDDSACALSDSGEIKCWGQNRNGNLGGGFPEGTVVGNRPQSMGDTLPTVLVEPYLKAIDLACGSYHCCAILENGGLKCWGDNRSGQLGLGDVRIRGRNISEMGSNLPYVDLGNGYSAEKVWASAVNTCAQLRDERKIKCWGGNHQGQLGIGETSFGVGYLPNSMGDTLPFLKLDSTESK